MFTDIAAAFVTFIVEWKIFGYGALVAALLIVGFGFVLGGEFREKAKTSIPYILIGTIIIMCVIQIADAVQSSFVF